MNRVIYPSVESPIQGDVVSTAGSNTVRVVGIQNIPVAVSSFQGGEVFSYNINTGFWTPRLRACVQVNGLTVSTDYDIAVNTPTGLTVNGSGAF